MIGESVSGDHGILALLRQKFWESQGKGRLQDETLCGAGPVCDRTQFD
jgi:hypothetical protein